MTTQPYKLDAAEIVASIQEYRRGGSRRAGPKPLFSSSTKSTYRSSFAILSRRRQERRPCRMRRLLSHSGLIATEPSMRLRTLALLL